MVKTVITNSIPKMLAFAVTRSFGRTTHQLLSRAPIPRKKILPISPHTIVPLLKNSTPGLVVVRAFSFGQPKDKRNIVTRISNNYNELYREVRQLHEDCPDIVRFLLASVSSFCLAVGVGLYLHVLEILSFPLDFMAFFAIAVISMVAVFPILLEIPFISFFMLILIMIYIARNEK